MSVTEMRHGAIDLDGYRFVGKKSWFAYFKMTVNCLLLYVFLFFMTTIISFVMNSEDINTGANPSIFPGGTWISLGVLALYLYEILVLRSYEIFTTKEGIWFKYGILPWSKGSNGVRWEDADMVFFYPGFISWITNSYTVTINHKYTNISDFKVKDVGRGREVVAEIRKIQIDKKKA